jgi:hypothetical protein
MKKFAALGVALLALLGASSYAVASDDDDDGDFNARLIGLNEVPSISTLARGTLALQVRGEGAMTTIDYVLSYSGIEGGTAFASHIHLGQRRTNGGVSAFLCGGGDKPPCPAIAGTVTGTIDAADVIGPTAQGIDPGQIDELVRAMRAGATYANVHSTPRFPGGEIRGQIRSGDDNEGDDDD